MFFNFSVFIISDVLLSTAFMILCCVGLLLEFSLSLSVLFAVNLFLVGSLVVLDVSPFVLAGCRALELLSFACKVLLLLSLLGGILAVIRSSFLVNNSEVAELSVLVLG